MEPIYWSEREIAYFQHIVLPECERRSVQHETLRGAMRPTTSLLHVALAWLGGEWRAARDLVRSRGAVVVEPKA